MTLVHPRTSSQGPLAWQALRTQDFTARVTATAFCLTSTSVQRGMQIRGRFNLSLNERGASE